MKIKKKRIIGLTGLILCESSLIIYGILNGFDSETIKALIFTAFLFLLCGLAFSLENTKQNKRRN